MKVNFAHICDYASISREGKLSAMGIFDNIGVRSVPATHPALYLAFQIEMQVAEFDRPFKLEVRLATEDGQVMMRTQAEGRINASKAPKAGTPVRIPQIMALGGLSLPKFGRYAFDIFINDDLKTSAAFDVIQGPAGKVEPPPSEPQA